MHSRCPESCPQVVGLSAVTPKTLNGLTFCNPRARVFASDPDTVIVNGQTQLTNVPRFGNSARNIFRGARQEYVNASLFKNLQVSERFNIQLRAQAYNLFNHPEYKNPASNISQSSFGRITGIINTGAVGSGAPRRIEFMFRADF